MDIRNFVIAIRDTNTEQINMIMTRDDYDRYLSDLYHENKTDLTNIHDSLAKLRESFIDPTLSDWSNIYFSDNTALYARYCENDEMLTDFLSGKYNEHGTWRIDYDHITDACKDYLIKGLLSNREINEKKHIVNCSVAGYRIINKMDFRDRYGAYSSIVMGNNENAAAPWATWRYFPEHDNYDYGHYFMSEENAIKDFFERGVELTKVNLREEYINEMIIDDIKEVLSYDYHEWEIAELMSDESFISKAIDSWHSIDRSDDNDSLIKKLNSIINGASVSFNEIDEAQQTYTIKVTAAMDTDAGYIKVKNISKEKIINIAIGACLFEEQMEMGFDGLLKNAGAEIIHSWEEIEAPCSYDMEFCWDIPMLYDNQGNKMLEDPMDYNNESQPPFVYTANTNKNDISSKEIDMEINDKLRG